MRRSSRAACWRCAPLLMLLRYASTSEAQPEDTSCEKRIKSVQQQLQTISEGFSLCRATSVASEMRESMLQRQVTVLTQLHGAPGKSQLVTASDLYEQLHLAVSEAENALNDIRHERNLLKEAIKSLQQNLEAAQSSEDDSLLLVAEARSLAAGRGQELIDLGLQNRKLAEELDVSKLQLAAQSQAEQRIAAAVQTTLQQTVAALQAQLLAEREISIEALGAATRRGIELGRGQVQEEATSRAQIWIKQYRVLTVSNERLVNDSSTFHRKIDAVKEELFRVRRELHLVNGRRRAAELKRRLLWKRVQIWWERVVELVRGAEALANPHVASLWETTMVHFKRVAVQYPDWKRHALAILDAIAESTFQLLRPVQAAAQPHFDNLRNVTDEPRRALAASCEDIVKPRVLKLQAVCDAMNSAAADFLYVISDLGMRQCSGPIARGLYFVREHTAEAVSYVEASIAAAILAYMMFCRRRKVE